MMRLSRIGYYADFVVLPVVVVGLGGMALVASDVNEGVCGVPASMRPARLPEMP